LEKDNGQYDYPADVLWATGACLMVRSSVYRDLGGLDERFFAHMEEIDLCWRMQLKGWKVTVVPESVVYHVGGGTLPATSPFKLFLNYRNNLLMLENNLAATFALMYCKKGMKVEKATAKGMRQARWRICQRKMLDWLSAGVYLATLKTDCFKAVCRAHKEYRKLRKLPGKTETLAYIRKHGDKAGVSGIYRKWIILESLLKGDNIFGSIKERDFYNI
jgi:GT2 family glycosyltransferase